MQSARKLFLARILTPSPSSSFDSDVITRPAFSSHLCTNVWEDSVVADSTHLTSFFNFLDANKVPNLILIKETEFIFRHSSSSMILR